MVGTESAEAYQHRHRDVSGGWLLPAVFGAMDGIVTNVSLIAGDGGGGGSAKTIVLSGLAGLVAGAFSMATGEFISVSSQNELVAAEVAVEKRELHDHPQAETDELAAVFVSRGVDADLADRVAAQISAHPDHALQVHAQQELGIDPQGLPSPWTAASASFATFAVGAATPLLPYLLGIHAMAVALVFAGVAAFTGGGMVATLTGRPFLFGAARQLALAGLATAATYGIGAVIGTHVS